MFITLLFKVLPLYIIMFIGFIAGKYFKIESSSITNLLFYIFGPIVIFSGISIISIDSEIISLPILIWLVCSIISLAVYYCTAVIFFDNTRNILAFSSGSVSVGFFGLPVAIALFDDHTISIYLFCYIGILFFENSVGFYIAAKGIYTPKECLKKLIKLPALYATVIALISSYNKIVIPEFLATTLINIKGSYMILGTMLIGISISNIKSTTIDWKFIFFTIFIKYIIWPLLILLIVLLDKNMTKFYNIDTYRALILLAIIPTSGTGIILANMLNYQSDKISIMLLINTSIGLFYVPIMLSMLLY